MTRRAITPKRRTLAHAAARIAALEGVLADLLALLMAERDRRRGAATKSV